MRCPQDSEFWQRYVEDGNPEAARHLQHCAACRQEAARAAGMSEMLSLLPEIASAQAVTARFRLLAQATTGRQFTCTDALAALEAWCEGDLDAPQSFLVNDHLFWCHACAEEFTRAERLAMALRALPALPPPAVIAERLAAARLPWWQRMLQPVQPIWDRLAPAAGVFAAAALLLACILRAPLAPQVAAVPLAPPHIAMTPAVRPVLKPDVQAGRTAGVRTIAAGQLQQQYAQVEFSQRSFQHNTRQSAAHGKAAAAGAGSSRHHRFSCRQVS